MSKATTLDHLVASYFVQGVCSNKQADILPGRDRYHSSDFYPRGKAYLRILDRASSRRGVEIAFSQINTLKRAKWEKKWAPKWEAQIKRDLREMIVPDVLKGATSPALNRVIDELIGAPR
jgi:hypothetical protein